MPESRLYGAASQTLTVVDGNIDNFVWSVIARHFPDDNYNAPIHRARVVKVYMEETD